MAHLRRTTLALGLALALGCEAPMDARLDHLEQGLINGTPTNARPEVVIFTVAGGACTATMISPSTFVTAAHCVNFSWMSVGGLITASAIGKGAVMADRTFSQGITSALNSTNPDDIAVGHVVSPITGLTPAAISTVEPPTGTLTAVGYGCTNGRVAPCSTARTFVEYFYNGSPSNISGPGDSGGPTFIGNLGANGPIVRIHSGNTDAGGSGHDVGSDAVTYRSHILALSNALVNDGISYRAYVQSRGWMPAVQNGTTAGTTGQALRLEGLQVWSPRAGLSVCYAAYVQNTGWQGEVCDGKLAGTTGQSLRMEAVKIRLAARPAGTNGIRYNTYLEGIGWQGWRSDNAVAGTTGQSRRIEAIAIALF
jgi:hypothetical protein